MRKNEKGKEVAVKQNDQETEQSTWFVRHQRRKMGIRVDKVYRCGCDSKSTLKNYCNGTMIIRPMTTLIFRHAGCLITLLTGKSSGGAGLVDDSRQCNGNSGRKHYPKQQISYTKTLDLMITCYRLLDIICDLASISKLGRKGT